MHSSMAHPCSKLRARPCALAMALFLLLAAASARAQKDLHVVVAPVRAWGDALAEEAASTSQGCAPRIVEWNPANGLGAPEAGQAQDACGVMLHIDARHLEGASGRDVGEMDPG